jgi:hypothetical protein
LISNKKIRLNTTLNYMIIYSGTSYSNSYLDLDL